MAALLITYDLPAADQIEVYAKWAYDLAHQELVHLPDLQEIRAYRDPLLNSPQVILLYEFGSLDAAVQYMLSDVYKRIHAEATAHGVRGMSARLLETSPVLRGPVRPAG